MRQQRTQKQVLWRGSAKEDLSSFPDEAKQQLGYALYLLSVGEQPHGDVMSSMAMVGPGVVELRSHYAGPQGQDFRAFVIVKLPEAIYVLHAFEKKTKKTPENAIDIARRRLSVLMLERRKRKAR